MKAYRNNRRGFTLVEILIVVIILGILAAIVIPQFTSASQDARRSSLQSQLQTLRSQIELFKLQHGDAAPQLITTGWSQLTGQTTYAGKNYGPYMQAAPVNPLANSSTVAAAAAANVGWVYNETTGAISATADAAGTAFVE
jgi:general secretion pathway protein G